jgi:hypothetical protein
VASVQEYLREHDDENGPPARTRRTA